MAQQHITTAEFVTLSPRGVSSTIIDRAEILAQVAGMIDEDVTHPCPSFLMVNYSDGAVFYTGEGCPQEAI